jgi:hypothetical protein
MNHIQYLYWEAEQDWWIDMNKDYVRWLAEQSDAQFYREE